MIEAILVLTLSNTVLIWYFHYQQEKRNNLILETIKDHHFYYGRPEEDRLARPSGLEPETLSLEG